MGRASPAGAGRGLFLGSAALLLGPGVLQTYGLVEDEVVGSTVKVHHEIADALELQVVARMLLGEVGLHVAALVHAQAIGIEQLTEAAVVGRGVLHAEETVVLAHLGGQAVGGAHPVDGALDAAVGARHATLALGVVLGLDLRDASLGILRAARTLHDIGVLEAHLAAWRQAEELLWRVLHEVGTLDPQLLGEGDGMGAVGLVLGIVDGLHLLGLAVGIVGDDELHGVEDGTHAAGFLVEVVADGSLQEGHVVEGVKLRVADGVDKLANALRGVATTAHATKGRHAGIVPSADHVLIDKRMELALRHDGIGEVEAVELDLSRTIVGEIVSRAVLLLQIVDEEIVERTVGHKLQGADGVGHALEVVALTVGEIVHRVAVPLRSRAVVRGLDDAIDDRVAEVHVGIGHVDLGAQYHAAFLGLGRVHLLEEAQALLHGTVAVGAGRSGLGRRALLLGDLLGRLLIDIGVAVADHPQGEVPEALEIVARVVDVAPLEAEPTDVLEDVLHILVVFLAGVGIVEAEVAHAIVVLGHAEVHTDSLGMANMQVAIGLRREARLNAAAVLAFCQVFFYQLLHEADTALRFFRVVLYCCHIVVLSIFLVLSVL